MSAFNTAVPMSMSVPIPLLLPFVCCETGIGTKALATIWQRIFTLNAVHEEKGSFQPAQRLTFGNLGLQFTKLWRAMCFNALRGPFLTESAPPLGMSSWLYPRPRQGRILGRLCVVFSGKLPLQYFEHAWLVSCLP